MQTETAKLESAEQVREAIGVIATELVSLRETQEAYGAAIAGMGTQIRAFAALLDHHHEVLTKLAGLPPRPKGDPLAN